MPSPYQYVSFADVSLLCSTPDLEEEVNRLLALDGRLDWDGWNFASAGTPASFPTPSIPVAPRIKIGTLHWPNDATRPAWFYAVVDQARLDAINLVYTTPAEPQDLILKDGREGAIITARMSMLPPRPLSQLGLDSDGWLLAFTDQRFWWQWKSGSISEAPETWTALYTAVQTLLDITIDVDDIDPAYGTPTQKWIGYLRPPATVLDAVAASVGQRIVVGLDGTVRSVNWETARQESDDQWDLNLPQSMGGYIPSAEIGKYVPAAVNVAGVDLTTTGPNGEVVPKTEQVTLEVLDMDEYGDATGVDGAVSTVFVDFDYTGTSDDAAFSALVQAAGEDWYGWRLADLDIAFPGIVAWGPTGWEDFVEWIAKLTEPWIDPGNPHEPLVATVVRRPPFSKFPSTVFAQRATNRSYYVKLTGFGVGIDGGVAWGGIIQHEDGGTVVNNGYIGADAGNETFCMYRTLAEDGSAGNPEVGDVVVALPDPSMPGVWLFQPKRGTGPNDCGTCAWITDLRATSCLYGYMQGGFGRCSCITSDCENCDQDPSVACQPVSMVWVETLNGWLSTGMKDTCCGCGGALFQITDADSEEATLTLRAMHVSCETSSGGSTELFSLVLRKTCCGINRCGNRFMLFYGKGPQSCNEEEANCGNEFYFMVECAPCPPLDCSCCCIEESPPAFWQDFPSGTFIGGGNNLLNGMWIWRKDNSDPDQPCKWTADCAPSGKNSVLEKVGTYFYLTHDTFVYRKLVSDWLCSGQNTLDYVSGGSGTTPPVVVIEPILPLNFDTQEPDPLACTPPDVLTVEIVSADCPILNIVQAITRVGPSSNIWLWTNPESEGSRVTAIQLSCDNGEWGFSATAVCEGEPSPWEINSPGNPDTSEFDPFEVGWDSIDITGMEPSPTPDCCNVGTATVTITE